MNPNEPASPQNAAVPARQFFVVGAERSGTTLLRLMLDHHSQIACPHELDLLVDFAPLDDGWPDMDAYRDYLNTHRVFRASKLTIDPALDYPDLLEDFMRQMGEHAGKPVAATVVHHHFDRLLRVWPDAAFVHIVRDPRDVARSVIGMGWAGNVWTGVSRWREAEEWWERMAVPEDRYVQVHYEDLIGDPEPALRKICEFLGLDYDPAMLEYPTDTTYDAPDAKLVEQWRTKLTDWQVRLVETRAGAMLESRGYVPSGLPPAHVGPLRRIALKIHDRFVRVRHGIRRFGWRLMISSFLARRLRIKPWQRRIQLRFNEIIDARLK